MTYRLLNVGTSRIITLWPTEDPLKKKNSAIFDKKETCWGKKKPNFTFYKASQPPSTERFFLCDIEDSCASVCVSCFSSQVNYLVRLNIKYLYVRQQRKEEVPKIIFKKKKKERKEVLCFEEEFFFFVFLLIKALKQS